MAKKTAIKKKAAPAKAKSVKPSKTTKQAKKAKAVPKAVVKVVKTAEKVKVEKKTLTKPATKVAQKPALMTKKGKTKEAVESAIVEKETKKTDTIVSLIETDDSAAETQKAEKISKVKAVKVDRGNTADEKAKWAELYKKYGKDKAITYKMTETYPSLIPLQHKVLGWGFVLTNENDRLEVLFENGIRMLISNYKS